MCRRHSSSRRRNYGRRQHEVHERRPRAIDQSESASNANLDDWRVTDADDARATASMDELEGRLR